MAYYIPVELTLTGLKLAKDFNVKLRNKGLKPLVYRKCISSWAQLNIKPENLWRTLRVRHRFLLWFLIMPSYLYQN